MHREGIFICGYYTGCKKRSFKRPDGSERITYEVGILIKDAESVNVQVEKDVSAEHSRFDYVVMSVNSMRAFGGNMYISGEFIDTSAGDL